METLLADQVVAYLQTVVAADRVSTRGGDLDEHARDQSPHTPHAPEVIVWPERTHEVQEILRYAHEHRIAVTPFGAGTSLEGNSIPIHGGIVLDFRRMNRIVAVHAGDFQVTVEPGVLYKDLNAVIGKDGLFFAPDPGANASIGGMLANNAAGVRTVKYGATRDNVLALEVVLANGDAVRTGCRSIKQSSGYDLTHMFVGSEGTLGVITQATLRVAPIPEHFSAVIATFPTVHDAAQAVFEIMAYGLDPSAMEIMDDYAMRIWNAEGGLQFGEGPTLLMEFSDSTLASLEQRLALVKNVCEGNGCTHYESGVGREERNRLWDKRHRFFEILVRSHPGKTWLLADLAVPISQLPAMVEAAHAEMDRLGIKAVVNGHAGDGNLHITFFFEPDDHEYRDKCQQAYDELLKRALSVGGTLTGEHGVGLGKQKHMPLEHGPALALMRQLKHTLDPHNILNPGKVVGE